MRTLFSDEPEYGLTSEHKEAGSNIDWSRMRNKRTLVLAVVGVGVTSASLFAAVVLFCITWRTAGVSTEYEDRQTRNAKASEAFYQGRYAEAERLFKSAIQVVLGLNEKSLGPEHSKVANCLENIAAVCKAQKKEAEAEFFSKRAARIRAKQGDEQRAE